MKKRLLGIVMTIAMIIGMMPAVAMADESVYQLQNPVITGQDDPYYLTTTWDCIYFGNYNQGVTGEGEGDIEGLPQPIKWRVLKVTDTNDDGKADEAFLMADQNLDVQPYNSKNESTSWKNCTLRSWLNNNEDSNSFIFNAFNDEELEAIKVIPYDGLEDRITLLSYLESRNTDYGFVNSSEDKLYRTRGAKSTAYAKTKGAESYVPGNESEQEMVLKDNGAYWLRTIADGADNKAMWVSDKGAIRYNGGTDSITRYVNDEKTAVRPVMHLDLTKTSLWTYAGKVSSRATKNDAITGVTIREDNHVYTGSAIEPDLYVMCKGATLTAGTDYTVEFSNNTDVGTATVTVTGIGDYAGVRTETFNIVPADITSATATLGATAYAYNGAFRKPVVTVKVDGVALAEGTDYTVAYKNNKSVGKATVTITGAGNYEGALTRTFKINPKGTTIKAPAKLKKGFQAKWAKQSAKMATTRVTGYQVRYSLKKSMAGAKIKTVTGYAKTSVKVTGLKAKKKYFVQVRTYKTVGGVKYYSAWSGKRYVTTK